MTLLTSTAAIALAASGAMADSMERSLEPTGEAAQNTMQQTGQTIEQGAEQTGEAIRYGAEQTEDAAQYGTEQASEALDDEQEYDQNQQALTDQQMKQNVMDQQQISSIDQLPSEGQVTLSGIISEVDDDAEFTLQDSTGDIEVELSQRRQGLQIGDQVRVTGKVDSDWWGAKEIEAATVEMQQ
jgi:uncharacterized protein YdeI (BOF family)